MKDANRKWEWREMPNGWRRMQVLIPGFDCRGGCAPTCDRHPKGGRDYGQHGDEWLYAVSLHKDAALALTCFTSYRVDDPAHAAEMRAYVERRAAGTWRRALGAHVSRLIGDSAMAEGTDLTLHVGFPVDQESYRQGAKPRPCDLVAGGCFTAATSALKGQGVFNAIGNPDDFEQSPGFWASLETHYTLWLDAARKAHAALRPICPTCNGAGFLVKP